MEVYFNGYKIKYDLLNKHILPIRASKTIRNINIFINIDDLFHKMHRPYTDNEFQCIGSGASVQLISNTVNLIGHYKNWAVKNGMRPKIFLIYTTSDMFKNQLRMDSYRDHYLNINSKSHMGFYNLNTSIDEGLSLLQTLVKYIPRAYAIDTRYLEPSIVPLFISNTNNSDLNIMVSRDEYDLQYATLDKWLVISPKGENSTMVTGGNLWNYIKIKEKIDEDFIIHPDLFIWAKSIIGDRYRGIPKLSRTGWKTIVKYIRKVNVVGAGNEVLPIQLKRLNDFIIDKKISSAKLDSNMYCTSISGQVSSLLDIDRAMILSQMADMEDIIALRELNNSVFKYTPLNISFLLMDSIVEGNQDNTKYFWQK